MKITGYESQISNGGIANATIKTVSDVMAYGGNGAGTKAVAQGIGMWADVIAKKQEEDDKQNILKAMDEYNKGRFEIMYNKDNGLMNTVAAGAQGIDKQYGDDMKKLRSEVMSSTKLYNQKNMVALENLMNRSDFEGYQQVARHQYKQGEVEKDVNLSNILANNIELVQKDPGNIQSAFDSNALMVSLRYQGIKGGEAVAEAKVREANSQIVSAAIGACMDQDNYAGAQQILNGYGHFLTPAQRASISKGLKASEQLKSRISIVNELYSQYGDNTEAAIKAIDSMALGKGNITSKDDFFNAVALQESGGNYNATNERTGAFGKYQIMPENWASWAREAGLGEGAEQTPENQEKVAKYKLGQYFDKYGAQGALVAWYAGEQNAKRWVDGKKDAIGDNGEHYSWDAKQGNGDEPSIREYVNSALSKTVETDELALYKEREAAKQMYYNKVQDEKRLENSRINKLSDAFSDDVFKMLGENVSYEQAVGEARKRAGSNIKLLKNNISIVDTIYGAKNKQSSSSNNKEDKGVNLVLAKKMMADGAFNNASEYMEYVGKINGVTELDLLKARADYKDMQAGVKGFAYKNLKDVIEDVCQQIKMPSEYKATYKAGVEECAREEISRFHQQNNRPPTMKEAYDIVKAATQTVVIGEGVNKGTISGFFNISSEIEMSPAQMRAFGIKSIERINNQDLYLVRYTEADGRPAQTLTGEEIQDIRRR